VQLNKALQAWMLGAVRAKRYVVRIQSFGVEALVWLVDGFIRHALLPVWGLAG
jgi:hypothetical protein